MKYNAVSEEVGVPKITWYLILEEYVRGVRYKSKWWEICNHLCEKFGLRELVDLLWLRNIGKEGMAIFGMEYDMDVWKTINVEIIK